ncbi:phosphotransferase family protein [Camelimonas abortus]|uniref:Phosphotransferase family protein n=1 Tax=Camelimonas abortus TaxID=1017184 RepID=A0ABV7LAX3_9HYPH
MEHGVDLAALARWMDSKGLGSGPLEDVKSLAGGTQNILLRFNRDGRGYVLRRPPLHLRGNSNKTMQREARMLAALADTDVPHPRFIASCEDDSVLGAFFYLMEPIEGFNATQGLPPCHAGSEAARHRMGLSMVEAVAKLGAVDYVALGLSDFGKVDNYLERQVDRWRSQLESYHEHQGWPGPDGLPGVERVAGWLAGNIPPVFRPGIIHGDYHLANVMFRHDSPELAAIIDWELTTIGDPLLDLGWLMATWSETDTPRPEDVAVRPWKGFPTIPELVEHYGRHSDRDLTHIRWYGVLACYKLGIIIEGTHARACAGKAPRATGDKLHAHAVSLFERALRWIG